MPEKAKQRESETRRERAARRRKEKRVRLLLCALALTAVLVVGAVLLSSRVFGRRGDDARVAASVPPEVGTKVVGGQTLPRQTAGESPLVTPRPLPSATPVATVQPTIVPWVMPETTPAPVEETRSLLITAVGDCTLGGDTKSVGFKRFDNVVKEKGYDYFLENVRTYFENDDITIANLEGPLTKSKNLRPKRVFNFRGRPAYVQILSGSSVEVCNVANNHSYDFGKEGLVETAKTLKEAGIGVCGYTVTHYQEVKGLRVGFVGFTRWDHTQNHIVNFVKKIRPKCDVLIVSMHWGQEGEYAPDGWQKKCGRAIIDAGADLVLGHHPHVVSGVEKYHGKYIIYSLANFCFGGNGNPADMDTMIFQQRLDVLADGNVRDGGINIIPCSVSSLKNSNNFQPTPLTGEDAARVFKKIKKYSKVKDPLFLTVEE